MPAGARLDPDRQISTSRAESPRARAAMPASARSAASSAPCATATTAARVTAMELEHYPGMTEKAIEAMIDEACRRFDIRGARVIHRIGPLQPRTRSCWWP